MKTYTIKRFTRKEGGEWHAIGFVATVTIEDLEKAQRDSYYDGLARAKVGKVPSLPVSFHALLLEPSAAWDVINGFR